MASPVAASVMSFSGSGVGLSVGFVDDGAADGRYDGGTVAIMQSL